MTDGNSFKDARRAYLQRLGNPYAAEQIEFQSAVATLENPYSALYYRPDSVEKPPAVAAPSRRTATKAEFQSDCRRIFRQYLPRADAHRLRAHHRDFIARNENRSGRARAGLLAALAKYDLQIHGRLRPQFNREREDFTVEKLAAIERSVSDAD